MVKNIFCAMVSALAIFGSGHVACAMNLGIPPGSDASFATELRCLQASPLNTIAECRNVGNNADPVSVSVTELVLTMRYDPSLYIFDQALSGPLGIYSVGGDTPPVNPGIGTQLVQLQPSMGDNPGAPLPGSTLTYTNAGGVVTVDYHLASPITQTSDQNFFLLEFDFVNPVVIDLARSTITYATTGPGTDFTQVSFVCTTTDPTGGCGSDHSSTGISFNLAEVPEPSSLFLVGCGIVFGLMMRIKRAMLRTRRQGRSE